MLKDFNLNKLLMGRAALLCSLLPSLLSHSGFPQAAAGLLSRGDGRTDGRDEATLKAAVTAEPP